MPIKQKVALSPVLGAVIRIVRYLKDKGPASPSELLEKVGSRKRTYYRALKCLQEAEVVVKRNDGYLCWYESIETRVYTNEFEAEEALNHSRNIVKGLRFLRGGEKRYFSMGDANLDRAYLDFAIMHLNTGYPEIYSDHNQANKLQKGLLDIERRIIKRITDDILPSHEVLSSEHLGSVIIEDIKATLTGRTPLYLEGLILDGDEVKTVGYTLTKKDAFEELKDFMIKQEDDEENRRDCGDLISLGARYYKFRQSLENEISVLIRKVENGTPLEGKCQICPKIKIVQTSTLP